MVVARIGTGALMTLRAQGIRVHRAIRGTGQQNIDLIRNSTLPQFDEQFSWSEHPGSGDAHS